MILGVKPIWSWFITLIICWSITYSKIKFVLIFFMSFTSCNCGWAILAWVSLMVKKTPPANAGGIGALVRKIPGGGHGNSLQYSCLRISWTEEPGGLQSIGLQWVGHNCSNLGPTHAYLLVYAVFLHFGYVKINEFCRKWQKIQL